MIPITLTIQGLYSYQEKQTIDFTRLTAANLFGIFGTVGSGKSSILEAITYAIYGKTTRLNQSGDNRNYNMMNLKSNELFIDFIFETGKNQTPYRATVKGKRNSKNFEDVKSLNRTAYKKVGENWIPVETEELEQAIGLSYDNFRRTIIIPQGQFQEFLQLGNKDRTQMMKELFDLGKYEFYYKVASLETKNNARRQTIEGQLQQVGKIDASQVKQYGDQLIQLKKEIDELNLKISQYQLREEELKQLQLLTEKIKATESVLNHLIKQEPDIRKLEKQIEDYEKCHYHFKHLIDSAESGALRILSKEKLINRDIKEIDTLEITYTEMEKQQSVIRPAYEKREQLKQKAEELGLLIKIKNLELKITELEERLKNGKDIQEKTIRKTEALKKDKSELEASLKDLKQKQPDMNVLADVRAWYIEKIGIEKQLVETDKNILQSNQDLKHLEKKIQNILSDPLFENLQDRKNLQAALIVLEENYNADRQRLRKQEQEASELAIKERLHQFAGELHDGKSCPLCGSLSHPVVYTADNIRESRTLLNERRTKTEQAIETAQNLGTSIKELNQQMQFNERELNDRTLKRNTLLENLKAHDEKFVWDKYRTIEELDEAFKQAARLQSMIKSKETALEELSDRLEKEQNNKERYQSELDKITNALTAGEAQKKTLNEQLKNIDPDAYNLHGITEIEQEKKNLADEYIKLEEKYTTLNNQIDRNRASVLSLTGGLEANRKELIQERETQQKLSEKIEEQLRKTNYQSVDAVKQILTQPIELDKEKKKLSDFRQQLAILVKQQEQLQLEINNREYNAETHEKLRAEIQDFKQEADNKNQATGKINELLKKLKKDLENQSKLRKELEQLETRAENIKTMKSLFKASGFVNYISSVYLQNLCNAANERFFQLTRQKMSLEITSDNNFQVRDFMNGGKVRSVKTLSGGQTFQAALSLALALADNIQKITESNQNFFFLDEGFGSLDRESLSVVFDTLKTLRKENRIVGVISHVEEMQQEIDMYLHIDNHEEKGSIIKPCWIS